MGDVALLIPGQRFARNLKPVVPRVELTSCSRVPPDRSRVEPVQCRIDSRSRLVSAVIAAARPEPQLPPATPVHQPFLRCGAIVAAGERRRQMIRARVSARRAATNKTRANPRFATLAPP